LTGSDILSFRGRVCVSHSLGGEISEKMATPWLTDAGAGRRLRWSLDIVERCSVQ